MYLLLRYVSADAGGTVTNISLTQNTSYPLRTTDVGERYCELQKFRLRIKRRKTGAQLRTSTICKLQDSVRKLRERQLRGIARYQDSVRKLRVRQLCGIARYHEPY
jgi:hypothetical protein